MSALRLLLDENVRPLLAEILRARGYDAVWAGDVGLANKRDREILRWAAEHDRVVLTHDVEDYPVLGAEYARRGWEHAGIIVSEQADFRVLLARTLRLLSRKSGDDLRNVVEWLHNYR